MEKIVTYDTTLRDGTQGEDVAFSAEDKVKIARRLDAFGIDYIEGGWPGSNPKDMEFFERMRGVPLTHAKLSAFGSTRRAKNTVEDDANVRALLDAGTPVVTIFGKTWRYHVQTALQITEEENLEIIRDTVRSLAAAGREVIYDAEHFFDGYRDDPRYALSTLEAARQSGASTIVLCDTNGGMLPWDIAGIVKEVKRAMPDARLGIHTHNDGECAVANAIVAVKQGCMHVQGTINGYGERCGNANLCSIIPVLELKMDRQCVGSEKLRELTSVSHYVSELANVKHRKNLPFVGTSAFAHKGGIHVSAVMKSPATYEHCDPETIGNARRVLISDLSGKSNVLYKVQELGLSIDDRGVQSVVDELKSLEHEGYQYEDAEGSFELMVKKASGQVREFFALERFKVSIHKDAMDRPARSEAVIKIRVGGISEITAAEGDGPVNALDRALRKALERFYPQLAHMRLTDYKVRVLDTKKGTEAKVRVLVETEGESMSWNTVGVSTDVVEASWKALVDSVSYHLLKSDECRSDQHSQPKEGQGHV
ncbi:MAG: citramalate synthase [Acidobacteriota bacterium]